MCEDGKTERERGISKSTGRSKRVEGVMADRRISNRLKGKVMSTCVTPTCVYGTDTFLTRFNKIATQGAPQMAVDKEANSLSRVYSYYSKFNLCLFYV